MRESYSIKTIFKNLALKNVLYYNFILHRSVNNWERALLMKSDKKMFSLRVVLNFEVLATKSLFLFFGL